MAKQNRELCAKTIDKKTYVNYFLKLLSIEENAARANLKKYNLKRVEVVKKKSKIYQFHVPGLSDNRPSLMPGDTVILTLCNNSMKFLGSIQDSDDKDRDRNIAEIKVDPGFINPLIGSNPEQRLAVTHIVSGSSGLAPYILHGPPGTGKTVTIVEAILQLVRRSPRSKILVCADSNMAADNVACSLLDLYKKNFDSPNAKQTILRLYSSNRKRKTVPRTLLPYSIWSEKDTRLDNYCIVVATLSHTAKYRNERIIRIKDWFYVIPVVKFTHLFIDEAAQASEPACLIPITGLLKRNGVLVLAGDNKQLGPVVISPEASSRGLGLSLMERLHRDCPLYNAKVADAKYSVMLRNNFRSHQDILALPNELFYGGQLRYLADAKDPITFVNILNPLKPSRAAIFHGVRSKELRNGKSPSFWNPKELDMIKCYIENLTRKHGVKPDEIGVVTPYNLQVCKVKRWLQKQKDLRNGVEVGTVESFQGKEKRVIIISTVRARYSLGFLVDDKRFNVALTRAKSKVIVIGNPLCLYKDDKWRCYMELCRQYGTYLGFDPERGDDDSSDDDDLTSALESLAVE